MDPVEDFARSFRLVGLQMADEMPSEGEVREGSLLPLRFLHPILAEVPQTGLVSLANPPGLDGLGDCHQSDFFETPSGSTAGGLYPPLNSRHIFTDCHLPRAGRRPAVLPP